MGGELSGGSLPKEFLRAKREMDALGIQSSLTLFWYLSNATQVELSNPGKKHVKM